MSHIECRKCGNKIEFENAHLPCPKCGSGDRIIAVDDAGTALEMAGIKETPAGQKEYTLYRKIGNKWSYKGKQAREKLTVDRINKRKRHIVEELNENGEWVVVHDEDVPI